MGNIVSFWGLEFDRRPVAVVSSQGTPFTRWVPIGMPRVPDRYLDCVFYLYANEEDARAGRDSGGTGFLGSLQSKQDSNTCYVYAITNWHVACRGGFSVIRLMKKDGTPDVFSYDPSEWIFDPEGDDIAAVMMTAKLADYRAAFVPLDQMHAAEPMGVFKLGIGDDVFMIGRFVDHDGGDVNMPTVRFGNISMMPTPIEQPNGNKRPTYCLDMHSRSGYSGSPVFVYRTPGWDLGAGMSEHPGAAAPQTQVLFDRVNLLSCLGIHWGQFPEIWKINGTTKRAKAGDTIEVESVELDQGEHHILGVSGMTCVSPLAEILKLLDAPVLKQLRDAVEAHLERTMKDKPPKPSASFQ